MLADRLVLTAFASRFFAALVAALAVHSAVEIVDLANVTDGRSLLWYPFKLPQGVVLVSPIAMLVGGCWTCVHLVRSGQLTALEAAGRGVRRAVLPLAVAGLVWSGLMWIVSTSISPRGTAAWAAGNDEGSTDRDGVGPRWVWNDEGQLVRLGSPTLEGYRDVLVITLDGEGRLVERWEATRMDRAGEHWVLHDVVVARAGLPQEHLERRTLPSGQMAMSFTEAPPSHLTGVEIGRASRDAIATGADNAPYEAERGLRAALVAACPVCVMLGAFIGVVFGRRPALAAAAVAMTGLLYWGFLAPMWAGAMAGSVSRYALSIGPAAVLGTVAVLAWIVGLRPLLATFGHNR